MATKEAFEMEEQMQKSVKELAEAEERKTLAEKQAAIDLQN